MPYSLRVKVNKLAHQGHLTRAEADRIRDALAKQIPKKVGYRRLRESEWGSHWYCPECEADLVKVEFMSFDGGEDENKVSYCWHCGKKVDWSEGK